MANSSYILGQYNNLAGPDSNETFMTLMTNGECGRCQLIDNSQAIGISFQDECLRTPGENNFFKTNGYYYFHGKIRRMSNLQSFNIKMINVSNNSSQGDGYKVFTRVGTDEQFIKTIVIPAGVIEEEDDRRENENWIDISFCFVPLMNFNCIAFELTRTTEDYYTGVRYPKIIYEEISIVNNLISKKLEDGVSFIKIGVQSRPGFLMNINGEEIRTNRSGIYELKNGLVLVSAFSAVSSSKFKTNIVENTEISIKNDLKNPEKGPEKTASVSLVDSSDTRERYIDGFTLDYLYKGKREE